MTNLRIRLGQTSNQTLVVVPVGHLSFCLLLAAQLSYLLDTQATIGHDGRNSNDGRAGSLLSLLTSSLPRVEAALLLR